jgi:hypothetical protein
MTGLNWVYSNESWHMDEPEGKYHACKGQMVLDQTIVKRVLDSVSSSDKWLADAFIKRLALYRYLYPRAKISPEVFINGRHSDREYLRRCSDKAFAGMMRSGKSLLLTKPA